MTRTYAKREQTHREFLGWLAETEKRGHRPACDVAAERAILVAVFMMGAVHAGGASLLVRELAEVAPPNAWFSRFYQEVWRTLCDLAFGDQAPTSFDLTMVHGDLGRRKFGDGAPLSDLYGGSIAGLEDAIGMKLFSEWDVALTPPSLKTHAVTIELLFRQRELQRIAREVDARIATGMSNEDFRAYAGKLADAASRASLSGDEARWVHSREAMVVYWQNIREGAARLAAGIKPAPTGILALDDHIGGLMGGDLVVIGARPRMGKTALAVNNFAVASANAGYSVAIFSLEMPTTQLAGRIVGAKAGVSMMAMRSGQLDKGDWGSLQHVSGPLSKLPLYFDDRSRPNVSSVFEKVLRLKRDLERDGQPPLGVVIIDYLQLMELPDDDRSIARAIQAITSRLKELAKTADVCIVLLSQLNRGLESRNDKRPVMSDLRESGAIEQDADLIIFPYRDAVYTHNAADKSAELIVAKFRNGEAGTVRAAWDGPRTRFHDLPGYGTASDPEAA